MTRSHHSLPAEANKLSAIHIANNDGVTYVNVYRRSLSSSLYSRKPRVFVSRDSQGLRRPRFSFFIFTCQTARGPKTPLPSLEGSLNPHSTANDNRLVSAVDSLILVRSLQARKLALAKGQDSAALSGRFISRPNRPCQPVLSTNRRITDQNLALRRSLDF